MKKNRLKCYWDIALILISWVFLGLVIRIPSNPVVQSWPSWDQTKTPWLARLLW